MKRQKYILITITLGLSVVCFSWSDAAERWQYPVDTISRESLGDDSVVTIDEALGLVWRHNPLLRSLDQQRESARYLVDQSGHWSNPQLDIEMEEVGWDAPGFRESELTIALSQELDLFGQRGARKRVAQAELDVVMLYANMSAYDLYLETKLRYYKLAHALEEYFLTEMAVTLAENIVGNLEHRISEGAALQSELLLARVELQRSRLVRAEVSQRLQTGKIMLASLWNNHSPENPVATFSKPDFETIVNQLPYAGHHIDSTRDVLVSAGRASVLESERRLARAEAKPGITLTGGYRRLEVDDSRSFLFGISLPLPFFNRNQGTTKSLEARLRSSQHEMESARVDKAAEIESGIVRLRRLIESYALLDSELVPTAEEAFQTLEKAYEAGRLPYASILEAGRSLIDLRFEHNNILLSIYEQIISLERITGLRLNGEL